LPPTHYIRNHCKVLGGTMLGYTIEDINKIQECLSLLSKADGIPQDLCDGLEMANSFFDGLWAEGYFD